MELFIGVVIAVAAAVLLARVLRRPGDQDGGMRLNRIGDGLKRLNANKQTYALMTRSLLDETEDDMLLEAVLSNLWAKMKPDLSDALTVIREQSKGRKYIFSIYAVTGGVKQAGFVKLKKSADAGLLPVCADGLELIGAPETAGLLREAMASEADDDPYREPYLESFAAEEGKEKMIAYIRANSSDFLDLT